MPVCYSDITKGEREIRRKTIKNIHLFRNLKEENIMNHKRNLIRGFTLILVMLVVAGCAAPTATPSPTVAAQAPPAPDAWRSVINNNDNVIFTFDPGDKCSMQIISKPYTNPVAYEIVVNDQEHLNYGVAGMTLNSGYTQADIDAWAQQNPNPQDIPPMMTLRMYEVVNPMSRTFHAMYYSGDPIYFSCITEGPDAHQVIAAFDPLVMPTK